MTALLTVLLALLPPASGPEIERIEPLHGGFVRPGEWAPVVVHIRSDDPFTGTLEIRADSALRFRTPVRHDGGGVLPVRVPVLVFGSRRPEAFLLRGTEEVHRKQFPAGKWRLAGERDLIVCLPPGADDLPRQADLGGGARAWLIGAPDTEVDDSWEMEPVDVVVGEGAGRGAWKMMGGVHRKDAEDLAGTRARRASRFPLVDERAWNLAPGDRWPESRRNFTVLFAAVYAFAGFVGLFWVIRRGTKVALLAAVGVLVVCFAALGWLLFPHGRVSLAVHEFAYRHSDGTGASVRLIFATALADGEVALTFDRRVRPVYREPRDAAAVALALEFAEGACTVRWDAGKGDVLCLLSALDDDRPPDVSLAVRSEGLLEADVRAGPALRRAWVRVRGRYGDTGAFAAGEGRTVALSGGGPKGNDFAFLQPRLHDFDVDNFLFAPLEPDPRGFTVRSDDLLEATVVGRFLVARFAP
ncbi:MAG: hypothetical protein ACYTAF_06595 [Planctomycetota bacterium]